MSQMKLYLYQLIYDQVDRSSTLAELNFYVLAHPTRVKQLFKASDALRDSYLGVSSDPNDNTPLRAASRPEQVNIFYILKC